MEKLHNELKQQISKAIENNKLSHAIILNGKTGYGILPLAHYVAKKLLCQKSNDKCLSKVNHLQHADYHFSYPFPKINNSSTSNDFAKEWKSFFEQQPFGNLLDWMSHLGAEKKQLIIPVDEAMNIMSKLNLRSYEGGNKVMLIWLAEYMNEQTANKLLKLIEEPPANTHFILVTEKAETMLPTILSRCQIIQIPRLTDTEIYDILVENYELEPQKAGLISKKSQGNLHYALQSINEDTQDFELLFIQWVRNAFKATKYIEVLIEINQWSQKIADFSREKQKEFLQFCSEIFRQALMQNYSADDLVFQPLTMNNFKWEGFINYIHSENITPILEEINQASLHIERNGNSKIIFLDLGIKLTRYIHRKEKNGL